ncbi:hypothetical protein C1645_879206 [Glomus cerebriforme]|uniref:Uncharacterized protein n=1 Tax=Glomus cerebriforme TaxID=658196 RepID=A0A397SL33_9GLOM|nr:hypothetical protein C1645_879206 [Glomus cerebriforme]
MKINQQKHSSFNGHQSHEKFNNLTKAYYGNKKSITGRSIMKSSPRNFGRRWVSSPSQMSSISRGSSKSSRMSTLEITPVGSHPHVATPVVLPVVTGGTSGTTSSSPSSNTFSQNATTINMTFNTYRATNDQNTQE